MQNKQLSWDLGPEWSFCRQSWDALSAGNGIGPWPDPCDIFVFFRIQQHRNLQTCTCFQVNRNVFVVVVAEFSLRRSHLRLCFTSRSGCLQDSTASADLSVVFVHYHYGGKEAKRQRACKCVMAGIPYHLFTVSAGKRID